jgi:phytol kinase
MSIDTSLAYESELPRNSRSSDVVAAVAVRPAAPPIVLCRQEISRKIWHMSAGLIPFLLPLFPAYGNPQAYGGVESIRIAVLVAAVVLMGLSWFFSKAFVRPGEKHVGLAMGCYVFSVCATLIAFPDRFELGMTVLAILAVGDGAAGIVGMAVKGPRLPWNPAKTVAGTLGFVMFAVPVASVAYWLGAIPHPSFLSTCALVTVACTVAAVAESWASTINDNLRVGLAAAVVLVGHHVFF